MTAFILCASNALLFNS